MDTKSNTIHVRMTPDEYSVLKAIAILEQLKISKLVRNLIRDEARRRELWPPENSETV